MNLGDQLSVDCGQSAVEQDADAELDLLANAMEIRFNAVDEAFDFMGLFHVEASAKEGLLRFFDQEEFAKKWINEPDFRDSVYLLFAGFDASVIKSFFLDYGVEKDFAKKISSVIVQNRVGEKGKRTRKNKEAVKKLQKFFNKVVVNK